MGTERMGETADLTTAGSVRWGSPSTRERNFWIALACAVVFHATFLISAIGSKPPHLGDPTGDDKAISVSLVTEADLKSRSTVAVRRIIRPRRLPLPRSRRREREAT